MFSMELTTTHTTTLPKALLQADWAAQLLAH
jgi:hypothetical protein